MNIQNLAVCFYGQWRTGELCLPYLKEMVDKIEDVHTIDYFCSVKNCMSFHAGPGLKSKGHNAMTQEEIEHVKHTIDDVINPKAINIMYDDPEIDFVTISENTPSGKFNKHGALVWTGLVDSLLLKQQYEAKTGVYYDAVLMLRYDVLLRPMNFISQLIKRIKETDDVAVWPNDPDSIIAPAQNHPAHHGATGHFTMFPRVINDLFLFSTGSAADRFVYETIEYMNSVSSVYGNNNPTIYEGYVDLMTGHNFFERIGGKISVNIIRTPDMTKPFWDESTELNSIDTRMESGFDNNLLMIVARPHEEVMKLDPKDNEDFWKINDYWSNY